MKQISTVVLAIIILYLAEFMSGQQLILSFSELNKDNIVMDIVYFALAYVLAMILIRAFQSKAKQKK